MAYSSHHHHHYSRSGSNNDSTDLSAALHIVMLSMPLNSFASYASLAVWIHDVLKRSIPQSHNAVNRYN